MLTFSTFELITLLVILPGAGAVFGYFIANDRMRRQAGGKTPAEVHQEFDSYKRGVGAHFQTSAELLQQMTEQYRAIYTHMAHGAVDLCSDAESSTEVEALKRLSLALDEAAEVHAATAQTEPDRESEPLLEDTASDLEVPEESVDSVDGEAGTDQGGPDESADHSDASERKAP